jgi:hypothetical protein
MRMSFRRFLLRANDVSAHQRAVSIGLITLLVALVCLRSWVPIWFPHAHFDSDQAVLGLMGKDIALGRAYPLFIYGQRYILAVGSWLSAPLFTLFGVSVTALKFPLFAMNLACVVMLWFGFRKERALGPWGTALAILPFAAASVVVATRLVESGGGNMEPIFFLLLAFTVRDYAVPLGVVFGLAFLNREYTPIGFIALLLADAVTGGLRRRLQLYGVALLVAASVVLCVRALAEGRPNYYGNLVTPEPANPIEGLAGYLDLQLPTLLGAVKTNLSIFMSSRLEAGQDWLRWVVGAWAVLGMAGLAKLRRAELGGMSTYLLLIGLGQIAAFALFCGAPRNPMLLRYVLPSLCVWLALTAYAWKTPQLRSLIALVVLLVCASNVRDAVRVAEEYVRSPPRSENEQLAEALLARGVRYAEANFWVAYAVSFLTNERVIASPARGQGDRIERYQQELAAHRQETVTVSEKPCPDGEQVLRWYLCK